MKRLLTIGHSYVVALNRRLAHEMARAGAGTWEVTAVAPSSLPGDLRPIALERFDGEACRLVPLPVRAGRSAHLRFYGGLRSLLGQPWDVVHCWEEPYVAAGWQVARRAAPGARLVIATFQNMPKAYPPPFSWMERSAMRRADGWIAFGRTVHEAHAGRQEYAARPSRIITPGVDLERFAPDAAAGARTRASLGWNDGTPVVGFVGRFVPEKGLGVLTAALREQRSGWRALFVGDGPALPALRAFAAAHPGRVAIATDVPHDAVPHFMNAMDLLCAPSQTTSRWREQFGRMLIEAMACGVPVVASKSGEIPHVIQQAGVVVAERDVAAWAHELAAMLGDEGRRRAIGRAGLERARAVYGWAGIARQHLDFFDEVASR